MRAIIWWAILLMIAWLGGGCISGCTWLDPGGQVARGLGQEKTYKWDENGAFSVSGQGPQTERFTMLQGAKLAIKYDAKGNEVIDWDNSEPAYYLRADPSAEAAGGAMAQGFEASTRQAEALAQVFTAGISAAVQIMGMRGGAPATQPAAATDDRLNVVIDGLTTVTDRLDRLLTRLEK